jgi:hypothetical protein
MNGSWLETIAIVLIVLWIVGICAAYTLGGLIHVFLALGMVAILVRLIRRPPVA